MTKVNLVGVKKIALKLVALLILVGFLTCFGGVAGANQDLSSDLADSEPNGKIDEDILQNQMDKLDFEEIEGFIQKAEKEMEISLPASFGETLKKMVNGEISWSLSEIISQLGKVFLKEVVANASLLGKLVILAIICLVLQNLNTAFDGASTGKIAYMVSYLVLVSLAVASFALAVEAGREAVGNMVSLMQILMPILLTLLVAVGGIASAAIFHPILFSGFTIMGSLIENLVLPLLFFGAIVAIAGNISKKINLSNLSDLFKKAGMTLMGIFITVFLGLLSLQGVAGAVGDGVALRVAKYTTGAFVPVVGSMFSSALEAIISSSLLIKNAVGILGVVISLLIILLPLLKILCLAFIYKLASALIQPLGDGQVSSCLNDLGGHLIGVLAAVAVVGLMFFFSIVIVVGVGNLAVMLR